MSPIFSNRDSSILNILEISGNIQKCLKPILKSVYLGSNLLFKQVL